MKKVSLYSIGLIFILVSGFIISRGQLFRIPFTEQNITESPVQDSLKTWQNLNFNDQELVKAAFKSLTSHDSAKDFYTKIIFREYSSTSNELVTDTFSVMKMGSWMYFRNKEISTIRTPEYVSMLSKGDKKIVIMPGIPAESNAIPQEVNSGVPQLGPSFDIEDYFIEVSGDSKKLTMRFYNPDHLNVTDISIKWDRVENRPLSITMQIPVFAETGYKEIQREYVYEIFTTNAADIEKAKPAVWIDQVHDDKVVLSHGYEDYSISNYIFP